MKIISIEKQWKMSQYVTRKIIAKELKLQFKYKCKWIKLKMCIEITNACKLCVNCNE